MSRIASHRDAPAGVDERALSLWTTETKSARLVTTEGSFSLRVFVDVSTSGDALGCAVFIV